MEKNKNSFKEKNYTVKKNYIRKLEEDIKFFEIEKSDVEKYNKGEYRKLQEGNEIKDCTQLEKCELCNEESLNENLCIKCNNIKGYYYLNINSISKEQNINEYIDCVNEETKPSNFYFDIQNEDFKPCFDTCATCDTKGDSENNNCITCKRNYMPNPDVTSTKNCVKKCHFYYYLISNQYKCTKDKYCPLNSILLIEEKGKCTSDCKSDDIYKYKYDNQCFEKCPKNTITDNVNFICKDENINIPLLTETNHIFFNENITDIEIKYLVEIYSNNFAYTTNHISIYKSNNFSIAIYKNSEAISNLSLNIPKINFDICFDKIKTQYNYKDNLIMVVVSQKRENKNDKIISFSLYNSRNAKKIIIDDLCINDSLIIEENLKGKISDLDTFMFLTNQGIYLLNPNNDFYTDLCFHFKSPFDGKYIPFKERFDLFFPNISLCETSCSFKGINTTTNTSICICTFNNIINNNGLEYISFIKTTKINIKNIIKEINLEILRCYKDLGNIELYKDNYGSFIIMGFIIIKIILTIIHHAKYILAMQKYLYELMQTFIQYISNQRISQLNKIDSQLDIKQNQKNNLKEDTNTQNSNRLFLDKESNSDKKQNEPNQNPKKSKFFKKKNKNKNKTNNQNDVLINPKPNNNNSSFHLELYDNNKKEFESSKNNKKDPNININIDDINNINNINNINILMKDERKDINTEDYIKTEFNDMDYYKAIKSDKRLFCRYFIDKIKIDLLILNIFCNNEKINPWPIKLLLLIMIFEFYFFLNGLFFTEKYLEDIFNGEKYNFLDYMSRFKDRIFYITLIGIIFNYFLNYFILEEKVIKKILKRAQNSIVFLKFEMSQIIKNLKIRYNIFIIICFIISVFIWYYSFCFNNVYPSTSKEWILTSIILFFVMQVLYLLILLIETIIRFIAIKCKSERLFKMSQFIS